VTGHIDERLKEIATRCFGLTGSDARDLAEAFRTRPLHGGQRLMRQGEPGDALYFLVRGRLHVWHEAADGGPLRREVPACGSPRSLRK
jgi:CRP-like cAMP-binding protein